MIFTQIYGNILKNMRNFLIINLFIALAGLLGTGMMPQCETSASAQEYIQLSAEQMKSALRCPTEESQKFIDDCFQLVALGKVPESLVLSAFQYAMGKQKNRWVYFEKSLEVRCSRLGIDIYKEIEDLP